MSAAQGVNVHRTIAELYAGDVFSTSTLGPVQIGEVIDTTPNGVRLRTADGALVNLPTRTVVTKHDAKPAAS